MSKPGKKLKPNKPKKPSPTFSVSTLEKICFGKKKLLKCLQFQLIVNC